MRAKSPWLRLRQGAIFLGGALILPLLVYGPLDPDWTPVLLGGIYLLVALAAGDLVPLWPRVLILCAWVLGGLLVDAPQLWTLALGLAGAACVLTAVGRPRDGETPPILE